MDLASALVPLGASRKKLGRFAAALKLEYDCDDPGGLEALLQAYSRDEGRVCREIRNCLCSDNVQKNKKKRAEQGSSDLQETLEVALQEWSQNGLPKVDFVKEDCSSSLDINGDAAVVVPPAPGQGCCIDCLKPTSYVFPLLDNARLCETCERKNPKKYQLIAFDLAKDMFALSDRELGRLSSVVCDTGGKKTRAVLKRDVEKLADAADDVQRKQQLSTQEWRDNSFKTDHRGKTHKWKEWNSGTFQRKKQIGKQGTSGLYAGDVRVEAKEEQLMSMFELSGLKHAEL